MAGKIILLTYLIICWSLCPAMARDPNLSEPNIYSESGIFGGSVRWTFADTWVTCGVVTIAVMIYALPRIFDGPNDMDFRFQSESRQGYYPLNNRRLSSGGFRDSSWIRARLTMDAVLSVGEYRAPELRVNSRTARFKFPTKTSQENLNK